MKKLVFLSLIATIFGSFQTMANTNPDNTTPVEEESIFITLKNLLIFKTEASNPIITESEPPMCNLDDLPTEISMKVISEYPGFHELVNQPNSQFSDSDLTYMCQYIYIRELNPDAQDENGNTALHIAVDNVNYRAVRTLLEANANPTLANNDGLTVLDVAEAIQRMYDNVNPGFMNPARKVVKEFKQEIALIITEVNNKLGSR